MNSDAPVPAAQPTWRGSLLSGRSLRYAAGVLLVAGGYWAAAKGAEVLWLTGQAAAFWLATGVGIAVLYLGGLRWWPGVLLGNLHLLAGCSCCRCGSCSSQRRSRLS